MIPRVEPEGVLFGKPLHTFPDHALAPRPNRRPAFQYFLDPQPRARRRPLRQRARLEEAAGRDLVVGFGYPILPELPDDVDRDVVAARDVAVMEQTMQRRLAR